MKNKYLLLAVCSFVGVTSFAQRSETFERDYEPIRQELKDWDPVRGDWLASSIIAVSNQEPIPDRSFPENITPDQMFDFVPTQTMDRLNALVRAHASDNGSQDVVAWQGVEQVITRPGCTPVSGRSYGDPHLESFDGARYSFQTVGEFVLAKSNNGNVEIQTRQKARRDDFSLNTAVAMNVGGDRVCIYAEDAPGIASSSPVQVNGQPVNLAGRTHFLSNGGTIRYENSMYVVDWPTGETASARVRNSGGMSFLNISFSVFPCRNGGYNGLMGNANGIQGDDFNTGRGVAPVAMAGFGLERGSSETIKKQRQAWMAKEFAEEHRITQATSLFDYPVGMSTLTFTDRSFPRVFRSIDDLDENRRNEARRNCESNGISGADMEGCIYDNGFLNLPPSKRHVVTDPTEGIRLTRVDGNTPNTNTNPFPDTRGVKGTQGGTIFDFEGDDPIQNDPVIKSEGVRGGNTKTEDVDWEPAKDPIRTPDPEPVKSKPFKIDFGGKSSGSKSPSTPRPSSPRPSTPKPSGKIGRSGL